MHGILTPSFQPVLTADHHASVVVDVDQPFPRDTIGTSTANPLLCYISSPNLPCCRLWESNSGLRVRAVHLYPRFLPAHFMSTT